MSSSRILFHLAYLTLIGSAFVAGWGWQASAAKSQEARPQPEEVPPVTPIDSKEAAREAKERKARMRAFPTVVQQLSDPARVIASPYQDALMIVKCRGHGSDFQEDFLAAFLCKEAGSHTMAANLRRGVRLNLERVPMDEAPAKLKQTATADDILDFNLPVYWVKSFTSAEPLTDLVGNPGRELFGNRWLNTVVKSKAEIATGEGMAPMYFFGGDWGIYALGAERKLLSNASGGVRSAVRTLSQKLKELGITLVFVPALQPASVYPDLALGSFQGKQYEGRRSSEAVGTLLESLREDGVLIVDLYQHFRANRTFAHEGKEYPAWLNTDTHWTSWAAAEAAGQISNAIRSHVSLPAPHAPPESMPVTWKAVEHPSDIGTMDVVKSLGIDLPKSPTVALQVSANTPEAKEVLNKEVIDAPIHIMGDSFVAASEYLDAGIGTHLARDLGLPVRRVCNLEGAHLGAPREWVRTSKGLRPKVLVWVVVERALTQTNWQGGELIEPGY